MEQDRVNYQFPERYTLSLEEIGDVLVDEKHKIELDKIRINL